MSFEQAKAELGQAVEADNSPTPMPAPEQAATPATPPEVTPEAATPEAPEAPAEPASEADSFTSIDLNELPPELQAMAKSLQGDYTRKTQEIAEQRKQFEAFGEPETVQQAVDLYTSLQDPQYLQAFHGELTQVLEAQGLSPAQAQAEATRQVVEATQPEATQLSPELQAIVQSDPELAPAAQEIASLRAEVDAMKAAQAQAQEAQQLEQFQQALAGEIERQDRAIRESHPEYGDDDMNVIYELASFHDGNLMKAQEALESYASGRIEKYIAAKGSVAPGVTPAPNAATLSTPEAAPLETLEDGRKAGEDYLAAMGMNDLDI